MINPVGLLILFLLLCLAGAAVALLVREESAPQALVRTASLASGVLLVMSGEVLFGGAAFQARLWTLPLLGRPVLAMDRLSGLFAFVTGLVFLPASICTGSSLKRFAGRYSARSFGAFYHLLLASILLIVAAGDAFSFLVAWEAMSILSYFLAAYEHEVGANTRAGYIMLAFGEAGIMAVALAFLVLAHLSLDHLDFASMRALVAAPGTGTRWLIFLLTFLGFGIKAGLLPFNMWLPRAYRAASNAFTPVFAGVTLNLGLYGILRTNADLLPITQPGPGLVVLLLGAVTALVGILYATIAKDMKALLAHSSIENAGIITAALGAGFVFLSSGHGTLAAVAFVAALYHMTNHSLYKSLLFLGAGATEDGAGSQDMNRLGGLIKRMPWTALFFLVGALSIAGMPPFNGFVSEWLTLQTMLQAAVFPSGGVKIAFALAGAALALTAALAVTAFVKAFAMSFLGMARSEAARNAKEVRGSVKAAMGLLAAACLLLGVLPTYVIPVLDGVVSPFVHASATEALVPPFFPGPQSHPQLPAAFLADFHDLGAQVGSGILPGRGLVVLHRGAERNPVVFAMSTTYGAVVLVFLIGGTFFLVGFFTRGRRVVRRPAWDGGTRSLFPEMTYTATGFSNPVRVVFKAIFRPATADNAKETVAEHFRTLIRRRPREVHIVDRLFLEPVFAAARWVSRTLAALHNGSVNAYVSYILITLLAFLLLGRVLH